MKKRSNYGKLNWRDFLYGLLIAVGTAGIGALMTFLSAGTFPVTGQEWGIIGSAALAAALTYILKQLGSNTEGNLLEKEPEDINKPIPEP